MSADEERRYIEYMKSNEWHEIARRRMEIDNFTCAGCGCRGTVTNVLEVHHLSYKHIYHEENWVYEDLVCLCHACHKNLHRIMERVTNEQGRRGWKHNARIPATHVYNINGSLEILERKEQGKNEL